MHESRSRRAFPGASLALLRIFALRHLRADPWSAVLSSAAIAGGIAVLFALLVLQSSLSARLVGFTRALGTEARLEIVHAGGGGLPTSVRERVLAIASGGQVTALLDRPAIATIGARAVRVTVVGIDAQPAWVGSGRGEAGVVDALGVIGPQSAIVSPDVTGGRPPGAGTVIQLQSGDRQVRLRVAGVLRGPDAGGVSVDRVVLVPPDVARWLFRMEGKVTSLLVAPPAEADGQSVERLARELRSVLGADGLVLPIEHRLEELRRASSMVQSFAAFASTLALAVGGYLIFNAMTLAMVRERREMGLLLAIGESRPRLAGRALAMAVGLGGLGALPGLGAGYLLGVMLVASVPEVLQGAQTGVVAVVVSGSDVAIAGLMGPAAGFAGAALPVLGMLRLQPAEAMRTARAATPEPGVSRLATVIAPAGAVAVLAAAGAGLAAGSLDRRVLALGIAGALAVVPALLGAASRLLARVLSAATWRGWIDVRHIVAASMRESPARCVSTMTAATLSVAALVAVGGAMQDVERGVRPFADALAGVDLYVSSRDDPFLSVLLDPRAIRAVSGVTGVGTVRELASGFAWLNGRRIWIRGDDPESVERWAFSAHGVDRHAAARALRDGAVLVSTQIAHRERLRAGDTITLRTPGGAVAAPIAAIFESWSWPAGTVVMDGSRFRASFGPGASQLAVMMLPGASADAVRRSIEQRVAVDAVTGRDLRERVLQEVRAQLAPFRLVRGALALLIGVTVFNATLLAVMQRQRTIGVLRAVGMSRRQLAFSVVLETLLLVALASTAGLALGVLFEYLGIAFVVDATGLALQAGLHWDTLAEAWATAAAAALAGSAYPALRAARMAIVDAIAYE